MTPEMMARLRLSGLLLVAIVLQTTVVPDLRIAGTAPDLMLLLGICAGLSAGSDVGAVVGFAAGLLSDLFLQSTPLGLSALTYCLIGFGVGALRGGMLGEGRLLPLVITAVASAAGVVLFVMIGAMVGQSQLSGLGPRAIGQTAAIVAVVNGFLAVPVGRAVRWATAGSAGVRAGRAEGTALLK